MRKDLKLLSVVVPIFNEQDNIIELHKRLDGVRAGLPGAIEIIFVNDGSVDSSLDAMKKLAVRDKGVKIIDLSRNFGHQIAIKAGLAHVSGDAAVVMDADLQDPPELILDMVKKWQEGNDVVYAVRKTRKENLFLRTLYALFYRLLKVMSKIKMPLDAGDFCLVDRKIADILVSMQERSPFIRGLRSWVGYNQAGVEYERQERFRGRTKYSFMKLTKLALDGIFSFSDIPLKLAALMGLVIAGFSVIIILQLLIKRLPLPGTALIAILVLFLGGVQLITIGILGEYIARIHEESKKRPLFLIKEKINA